MSSTAMPISALQVVEQGEDLRLDGDVERRRRLVGDQQLAAGTPAPSRSSRAGAGRPRAGADRRRRAARARGCRCARAARSRARAPRSRAGLGAARAPRRSGRRPRTADSAPSSAPGRSSRCRLPRMPRISRSRHAAQSLAARQDRDAARGAATCAFCTRRSTAQRGDRSCPSPIRRPARTSRPARSSKSTSSHDRAWRRSARAAARPPGAAAHVIGLARVERVAQRIADEGQQQHRDHEHERRSETRSTRRRCCSCLASTVRRATGCRAARRGRGSRAMSAPGSRRSCETAGR